MANLIYTDGISAIDFNSNPVSTFGLDSLEDYLFNSYTTNVYGGSIKTSIVDNAVFSTVLHAENGLDKISVFQDQGGNLMFLNRDLRSYTDIFNENSYYTAYVETLASSSPSENLYFDMYESSIGFSAGTIIENVNKNTSNKHYIINSNGIGSLQAIELDLSLNYIDETGKEIIDCQNVSDEAFGNIANAYNICRSNNLSSSSTFENIALSINDAPSSTNSIVYKLEDFSSFLYDIKDLKHLLIPVKTNAIPKDNDTVNLGVITFDKELDVFQYKYLNNVSVDKTTEYITSHSGYSGNYNYIMRHSQIADVSVISENKVIVSGFTNFSFAESNIEVKKDYNQGLKRTASKPFTESTNTFGGTAIENDEEYNKLYNQLPVAFGNRLFPLSDISILDSMGIEFDTDGNTPWSTDTLEEKNNNVGYFNIAYGTKHGFILFRLNSYAPFLIPPDSPDGIELHIPGGDFSKPEYKEEGGWTPMSMAFSSDNNYLYTIVAKPDDRTVRKICIYNTSTMDTEYIKTTVTIKDNPFTVGVPKNVRLLHNGKILITSDIGGEYTLSSSNPDTFKSTVNFAETFSTIPNGNFSMSSAYRLHSTATSSNTWKGSNVKVTDSQSVSLTNTSTLDTKVLTPNGYINLENVSAPLITDTIFNKENNDEFIDSVLIVDSNQNPVAAFISKKDRLNNLYYNYIINVATGEVVYGGTTVFGSVDSDDSFITGTRAIKINKNSYALVQPQLTLSTATTPRRSGILTIKDDGDLVITENGNRTFSIRTKLLLEERILGSREYISLEGDKTYCIFLQIIKPDENSNTLQSVRGFLHAYNVSDQISLDSSNNLISNYVNENDIEMNPIEFSFDSVFGDNVNGLNLPEKMYMAFSHDVSYIALLCHNQDNRLSLHIIAPDKNALLENNLYNTNYSKFKHIPAILGNNAGSTIAQDLKSHTISGMEFSSNRRNLYILLTLNKSFKIYKIDIGDTSNYFNGGKTEGFNLQHSIPQTSIVQVSPYYFNASMKTLGTFPLPDEIDVDVLLNGNIQSNTYVTGMFKGLDQQIYLATNTENEDNTVTLGKIINPNHIIGSNSHETRFIKAGMTLN